MIEGRIVLPKDVFVQVCSEFATLTDQLLTVAKQLQMVADHLPPDVPLFDSLMKANVQVGLCERILKIVADEHMPPSTPSSGGGQGESGYAQ